MATPSQAHSSRVEKANAYQLTQRDWPRHWLTSPLIRGDGRRLINPTAEELDASLWGD